MAADTSAPPRSAAEPAQHFPQARPMSTATRLMSAGAYLDRDFRKKVIRELIRFKFRAVPPSYGYDAVTVLAHALAARRLRNQQVWVTLLGGLLVAVLSMKGVLSSLAASLLLAWLAWVTTYLRRVVTLQTLVADLKPHNGGGQAVAGAYPRTASLRPDVVERISRQQAAHTGLVRYSGYYPFVGAGTLTDSWARAEVVKPTQFDPLLEAVAGVRANGDRAAVSGRGEGVGSGAGSSLSGLTGLKAVNAVNAVNVVNAVIPFSVDDVINFVDRRLRTVLRDAAASEESIKTLEVERRWYQRSVSLAPVRRRWFRKVVLLGEETPDARRGASDGTHWAEQHDAAREYLCVRVGSWDQELVTTVFVGFDLRGDTLHVEFHTYVLPPIRKAFHLIERLPDKLGVRVLLRVGWDVVWRAPADLVRFSFRGLWRAVRALFHTRRALVDIDDDLPDTSEMRLGRYALAAVNRGARVSIREEAAEDAYHAFFQASDKVKYMQIVERQLMESIELFLLEHNVDLADHRAAHGNILNGDVNNNYGTAEVVGRNMIRKDR